MSDSAVLDLISKGFSALDIAWGAALDKVNDLPLGSTVVTKYGAMAATFGSLAAADKFANSPQSSTDLDRFFLEMGSQLPGVPGIATTGIAFIHEKIGEIFDGGKNEQQLLGKLLNFSNYLKGIPGSVSAQIDQLISNIEELIEVIPGNENQIADGIPYETYSGYWSGYLDFYYDEQIDYIEDNLPVGIVLVGDQITGSVDGTDYHEDGTSYQ